MSNRNSSGSGAFSEDLPEFDPDVVDVLSKAIAAMQQSEILKNMIQNAIEQDDFILNPDDILLDSEIISAFSKLYSGLPLQQLNRGICQTLKLF